MAALLVNIIAITTALAALIALSKVTNAAVYNVGDSAGWTTIGNLDYKQWSAVKTFQVGDVVQFLYNAQFHNVMRVTHAMFRECNASVPLESFSTGNESITLKTHGHHYFICGVPGHCQAGQKVDINVPRNTFIAPTPSSIDGSPFTVPPAATPTAPAPAPAPSLAASLKSGKCHFVTLFCLLHFLFMVLLN